MRPEEQLRTAVGLGIAKVNVNAELRARWFDTVLSRGADLVSPPAA
jgi:fructose/tagatose bisphosphate aldolase